MGTNIPGDSAFMKVPNGLGDYGVNYLASQTGDFRVLSAKIDNPAAHVADTYTFNFTDNGAGGVDLEVLDSGGTAVANVANFDASNPVSFNGIEVKLDGTPAGGDSFTMEPDARYLFSIPFSRQSICWRIPTGSIPRKEKLSWHSY